ncbi:berberine bridge enzyme-like 8 [Carica papaya]|uniref:berberine bridge enzyme-like 8 n=1 Tax=Carica papaya TaxID=3649 RepID=UPI000B8C9C40|nr:berberine bridge enzyme-like 8 [Carica papaya]
MGTSIPQPIVAFLILSAIVTVLLVPSASGSSSSAHEKFIHCLSTHASPSHPISTAIFTPRNTSYSTVLQNYIRNLRFNTSTTPKPFLIVTALHESHVRAAILCGQKYDLQMKIRSGGHDYEGTSYVASVPFFVLDMFNLRECREEQNSWVPAGVCPTVGVGGHFGGAGYGNMMRKYGLTVDNIVDAKMVDVKGRILDRKSMGEDLFWAITGR